MESDSDSDYDEDDYTLTSIIPVGSAVSIIRWGNRGRAAVIAALSIAVRLVALITPVGNMIKYYTTRSLFPSHRNPTIRFIYPGEDTITIPLTKSQTHFINPKHASDCLLFRIVKAVRHSCVTGAFKRAGMLETKKNDWNISWGKRCDDKCYQGLNPFQKINHFPGTWNIGRKDALARGLSKLKRQVGNSEIDFFPSSYILPVDLPLLLREMNQSPGLLYIIKPPASSRGRGIYLINSVKDIPKCESSSQCVVQKYISEPFLINKKKFDLRVYVCVTSFNPLRVYIYQDGLVRFATEEYSAESNSLSNRLAHLTNYSLNKKSENFKKNSSNNHCDSSSKWSLNALKDYLKEKGIDWNEIFNQITHIVLTTIISCEEEVTTKLSQYVKYRNNCFELYGFDILLDNKMKAHLLEVNVMPALGCGSLLDRDIKSNLVTGLLHLIGVQKYNRQEYNNRELIRKKNKILGFKPSTSEDNQESERVNNSQTQAANKRSLMKVDGEDVKPILVKFDQIKPDSIEKSILREFEDEINRNGNFKLIYPTSDGCGRYESFFHIKKYHNILLHHWIKAKATFTPAERIQAFCWLRGKSSFPKKQLESNNFSSRRPSVAVSDRGYCRKLKSVAVPSQSYLVRQADETSSSHLLQVFSESNPILGTAILPSCRSRPVIRTASNLHSQRDFG